MKCTIKKSNIPPKDEYSSKNNKTIEENIFYRVLNTINPFKSLKNYLSKF